MLLLLCVESFFYFYYLALYMDLALTYVSYLLIAIHFASVFLHLFFTLLFALYGTSLSIIQGYCTLLFIPSKLLFGSVAYI